MMTRKDYEVIASALRESRPKEGTDIMLRRQWQNTVKSITKKLREGNPRFDEDTFKKAVRS